MTNRGEVTNSLPTLYLATPGSPTTSVRPGGSLPVGASPYMMPSQLQHHQSLGSAFSLQPYATYPHGVIYQPVVIPSMLLQPGLGMMMPSSHSMAQPHPASRHRPAPRHINVSTIITLKIVVF